MRLGRKNKKTESIKTVQTVLRETRNNSPIFSRFAVQTRTERELYTTLRESVPIIDAALCKIIRLIGGFKIVTSSAESQKIADSFVKNVRTNGEMTGLESFVLIRFSPTDRRSVRLFPIVAVKEFAHCTMQALTMLKSERILLR